MAKRGAHFSTAPLTFSTAPLTPTDPRAQLWGPAHGGANQAVLEMLEDIAALGGVAAIPAALARARDKADPFRLMGFGHRVYKTRDPRAEIMAGVAKRVLAKVRSSRVDLSFIIYHEG